jgi:hypothetical protein
MTTILVITSAAAIIGFGWYALHTYNDFAGHFAQDSI